MRFHVLTLFPELIEGSFATSITGRALEKGQISLNAVNIRDYANNKHQKVDDYPYGGGAGMVMQAEPVFQAYQALECTRSRKPRVIYVTPQGRVFNQELAQEFSREEELVFLCGHYEGIDERVLEEVVTDYVSIGDYVLTGGELPALVMMDAISRLVPGVLNNDVSAEFESFHSSLLEYPQYSRPEVWHGKEVPEELLSGNHKKISAWRLEQSKKRTIERRPDLYQEYERRMECVEYLRKQKLLNMDMIESILADRGKIRFYDADGVVLVDSASGVVQVTAADAEAGERLIRCAFETLNVDAVSLLVLHQESMLASAQALFSACTVETYGQWVYTLKNPLPLCYEAKTAMKEDGSGVIALRENAHVGSLQTNQAGIPNRFALEDGYENQGIEKALETCWINAKVYNGQTPVVWVDACDEELSGLQKSMGLYPAKSKIFVLKK